MRLKTKNRNQKGFTLTPAMLILSLLMIAGVTFLIYINAVGKAARKVESSQIAKYAAETGIYQLKSQLAKLNVRDPVTGKVSNEWFKAKKIDGTCCLFNSTALNEATRTPANTSRVSDDILLKENFNNSLSGATSKYKITIEDGSKLGVAGTNPTATGSLVEGTDKYGNKIWSNNTDKNTFITEGVSRFGVKVDGFVLKSGGVAVSDKQSIYAVLDIPQNSNVESIKSWSEKSPSNYMLSSNGYEAGSIPSNDRRLSLLSNMIITGPVHTNDRLDFVWNGNFKVKFPSTNSINDKFTVLTRRYYSGAGDIPPPLMSRLVREVGQPSTQVTIYGRNFGSSNANNLVSYNDGATWVAPVSSNTTKMVVNLPATAPTYHFTIFSSQPPNTDGIITLDFNDSDIELNVPVNANPPDFKVYGIMEATYNYTSFFLPHEKVYEQMTDYRFIGAPAFVGVPNPYIAWDLGGAEPPPIVPPSTFKFYNVTYITEFNKPHRPIKVYDKLTYSGTSPKLYYVHAHKAPGTDTATWTKTHSHLGNIFGMLGVDLLSAAKPSDYYVPISGIYDWTTNHKHEISPALLSSTFSSVDDLFFYWRDIGFKPSTDSFKIAPLLAPNNVNFYTQREYANQVLKLTQGKSLNRNASNQLENLSKFSDDRQNGLYDASVSGNQVDFRSTYFGNDLKYTAGAASGTDVLAVGELSPKVIYVNDNKLSADYMKISATALTAEYKIYRYIEIPRNGSSLSGDEKQMLPCGVIFVKEGKVLIGGGTYSGNVDGTDYMYGSNIYGKNTIIDGRLSIVSYSEQKPTDYLQDNPGDIVITGNVIYKNKIFPYKNEFLEKNFDFYTYNGFRQYPYSANVNSSTWSSYTNWITNSDGSPIPNLVTDKADSLGLFAFNDIKIPVNHYHQPASKEDHYTTSIDESSSDCPCKDELEIHAQLIAGNKITQAKIADGVTSKNDRLIMYGSFYSTLPPNLSYFDGGDPKKPEEEASGRLYMFDKTLSDSPVIGAPSFPKDITYTSSNQIVVGTDLPRVVPGTWKVVTDGT